MQCCGFDNETYKNLSIYLSETQEQEQSELCKIQNL